MAEVKIYLSFYLLCFGYKKVKAQTDCHGLTIDS